RRRLPRRLPPTRHRPRIRALRRLRSVAAGPPVCRLARRRDPRPPRRRDRGRPTRRPPGRPGGGRWAPHLAAFQAADADPRMNGGYWYGRKHAEPLPFINPVSAAFATQALELWETSRAGGAQAHRHLLI